MWFPLVLCLCVGWTYGTTNPAWQENFEYHYEVRGRTLTGLHEISDQYSGIEYKSQLRIQPRSDGNLQAKIFNTKYAQIHMPLSDGWKTHIPDSELVWQPFPLSSEPFQIHMEHGVVKGVTVNKDISNWEANMIKGIVSQFQMKISERPVTSKKFLIPFTVREDTVTGSTETFYRITRMPDHMIHQEPNGYRLMQEKRDEEVYEITKQKNYTNSVELPSYFYGFDKLEHGFPATNRMGYFLSRSSFSRAVLTGNLNRFTIHNTFTVSEILVNPTLTDTQKGSVYSIVNVTLTDVGKQNDKLHDISTPVYLENLVYSYGKPFDDSNEVRERNPLEKQRMAKLKTVTNMISRLQTSFDETDLLPGSEESYKQEYPDLQEAPKSPLLRFTEGYKGQSVKQKIDVVQKVKELAKEIAEELHDSFNVLKKGSLNKFTILTSLIRIMDANEIRSAADELFNNARKGNEQDCWKIYRDSVAESGTGPALLVIQEWIQSGRIEGIQASLLLATMSKAVRQPSVQYMKTFFELIKSPKVLSNWPVNDTAILRFSKLVRQVYVDRKKSATRYPVKSFKNFRNEEGMKLLNESIIPYFAEKLSRAIAEAQTHKIHVYIRALGSIGDPQILSVFEPYLEGVKQASQFQRLLMVLAMNGVANKFPEQARSALVRIFDNSAETEAVRIAAVYQIMRTNPPKELLQYMASYSNSDKHAHVVAAVKSSIETISQLQGHEFQELRKSAEAAKPLLTKKTYGIQFGGNYIYQRVFEELNVKYKDNIQFIGSEDHFYPKGMKLSLHLSSAGLKKKFMNIQAVVSSVKNLIDAFKQQTSSFSQDVHKQKQNYEQQMQNPWSSQKIAEILDLQPDEREQLEGNIYYEDEGFDAMISFDNNTIPKIIKELTKFETGMQIGQQINFLKMSNTEELAIAFPTEMGLPFLYTYDTPSMIRVQGHVKATATPRISQEKAHVPNLVQMNADLTTTLMSKVQGRISFITPHDNQQYVSGYNKNVFVHFPLKGRFELDTKKMQIKAEFEREQSNKPTVLFHYGTIPFVSRLDILKFETASNDSNSNTRFIEQGISKSFEKEFGRRETGFVVRVRTNQEKPFVPRVKDFFSQEGIASVLVALTNNPSIQKSDISITSVPQESSTYKCAINLAYRSYKKEINAVKDDSKDSQDGASLLKRLQNATPEERERHLSAEVNNGNGNSIAKAIDFSVDFEGKKNISYTIFSAYVKEDVQPTTKVRLFGIMKSKKQGEEPYTIAVNVENTVENVKATNLETSMQNKPKIKSQIHIKFGTDSERLSDIRTQLEFTRSDEREQYLKEKPMYKQCRSEMKDGDNMLPACANISMSSVLLDRIEAKVQYMNVPEELKHTVRSLYYASKYYIFPNTIYRRQRGFEDEKELSVQARFDPDLRSVNVSISSPDKEVMYDSIHVNEMMKEIFVLHPFVDVTERVVANAFNYQAYRPYCVVDKTKISNFNNLTFPADLSDKWTLMFQYLPKKPRYEENFSSFKEQLKYQTENYVVMVRAGSSENERDVKITVSSPETKFQVVDITMTPRQQQDIRAKVSVNGNEIQFDGKRSYIYENGFFQMYTISNGEVILEINNKLYVLYDGKRVKLSVLDGNFKDATRGICGQFNEKRFEDFLTPENCFVQEHHKFIKSYEVEGSAGQQMRQRLKSSQNMDCVTKVSPLYVDVITSNNKRSWQKQNAGQCTAFQTQYVQQNGEVCFTIRPVPSCVRGCQPTTSIEKDVPVHCVQKSSVAQLWKKQIDNGGSPDFSQKSESKIVSMQMPQSCA